MAVAHKTIFMKPAWITSIQRLTALAIAGGAGVALSADPQSFPPDQIEFFEKNIRPVLAERCYSCHGAHKHQNGLRLDSREAIIRGSDYGKVITPGNASASKLIKAVKHQPDAEAMPKKGDPLTAAQIADLEKWINLGLPWPAEKAADAHAVTKAAPEKHWAFQPVKKSADFGVNSKTAVDELVGRKLKAAGLDFAPPAKVEALARRLFITLTGLPPSYEEVRAFVTDHSKNPGAAVDALVSKLLASPRYGERWARHWLDIARYSDTEGYTAGGKDNRYAHAYTYRDWVIKALNDDLPYDQFVKYQLAADRLTATGGQPSPHLAALGFLNVGDSFLGDRLLQTDDRIDVVSRGLMGITIACARCHDHKYDPIPSKDYYALYSIFNSSSEPEVLPIIGQPQDKASVDEFAKKVGAVRTKMADFKKEIFDDSRKADRMSDYLVFANQHRTMEDTAFRGEAGKAKLRDRVADKWRDFLNRHAFGGKPHPVMTAWKDFASLPGKEFAAKAEVIATSLKKPDSPANAVVRNELAKRPAPKSLNDVAAMYSDIFLTCLNGKEPDNEDWRSVRSLLMDRMSPMSVPVDGMEAFFTRKDREQFTKLENEIKKLEFTEPGAPLRAMVMVDNPKPTDVKVFVRGNPARQGDPAPRAYPAFLGGHKFTDGSGRLELANLIASRDNPLTARVIVNRVWMQHFGKPLVSQTSDFGVQTQKPEQAELLDYLAATFMEQGWSLKKLHHLILTSRTYEQSSESTPQKNLKDADNALLSRANRQRVDYETLRDTLLLAAGTLDVSKAGGRSTPLNDAAAPSRRSVYLFVDRYEQPTVPAMFDFANPDTHSPQRFVTTVPQQSLFLMNSPFMLQQANRLASPSSGVTEDQARALYRRLLARDPKPAEISLASRFLSDADSLVKSQPFTWSYGTMRFQQQPDGKTAFTDWKPFAFFNEKSARWTPTENYPDKQWSHVMWHKQGGHAGVADIAPALRWASPFDGVIDISGTLKKGSERGNGVRGWIVSDKRGVLKDTLVAPAGSQPMELPHLRVAKGEIITFAVGSEGSTDSDSFGWIPQIFQDGELLTDAERDFCDKDGWPVKRPKPQSPLSQLAQVLMMSNEFQFLD
jgi:hypothetical protein